MTWGWTGRDLSNAKINADAIAITEGLRQRFEGHIYPRIRCRTAKQSIPRAKTCAIRKHTHTRNWWLAVGGFINYLVFARNFERAVKWEIVVGRAAVDYYNNIKAHAKVNTTVLEKLERGTIWGAEDSRLGIHTEGLIPRSLGLTGLSNICVTIAFKEIDGGRWNDRNAGCRRLSIMFIAMDILHGTVFAGSLFSWS